MAISTYALVSLEELKEHLSVPGSGKDTLLTEIANRVSDEIEDYLARQIVTRGPLTEYHTVEPGQVEIETRDWPVITLTSVHEDTAIPRTYGSSALLVSDTDYYASLPTGRIRRVDGLGAPIAWSCGHRAIKLVYSAGYATTATVPARIKSVALRFASLCWAEASRGDYGISGASDQLGNYTRFAVAQLDAPMKTALASERRRRYWESGERDA